MPGAGSRRDNFSVKTRRQIEKKSGYHCSNPACRRKLIGPSEDFEKVVYMGTVSHIRAASPGGPRYDPGMTPEERAGEENGLLLCRYCAALVDADELSYPADLLRLWKRQAYQFALDMLSAPAGQAEDPLCWSVVRELVRLCLCSYQTQGRVSKSARFRSYAGILYQLFFESLPPRTDYDEQMELWIQAVDKIASDALEDVPVRRARYDRSFPRRYRYLLEELKTYAFDAGASEGAPWRARGAACCRRPFETRRTAPSDPGRKTRSTGIGRAPGRAGSAGGRSL